jgi:AcrR family transcriptional regulator
MNMRVKLTPEETRNRILDVAEEHFRRIGYGKTAVADIAETLGMSPANIYRYFPSKSAMNEAICARILDESHAIMAEIVARPLPADAKLRALILTLHRFNRDRCIGERRMHDMVQVAMEENWASIDAHLKHVVATFAGIIAEGVAAGIFRPVADPGLAALTVKQCCVSILHPTMIDACIRHGMETPDQPERIATFVIDALRA